MVKVPDFLGMTRDTGERSYQRTKHKALTVVGARGGSGERGTWEAAGARGGDM